VRDFEYFEPTSVEEAVLLLDKHGKNAKIIAGGTDLIPQMQERKIRPEYVINIGSITSLSYIKNDAGTAKIGTLTTLRDIEKSAELASTHPILPKVASLMASAPVRNTATIGGNLCNASPAADMAPPLIGLSASARVAGPSGERTIQLNYLFTGPGTTIINPNELLIEIQVPPVAPRTGVIYLRQGRRGASEVAIVGVAAVITLEASDGICKDAKIVLGSVAPTPISAIDAETILKGHKIDDQAIEKAARSAAAASSPISDIYAPAEYRKEMVVTFTSKALKAALELAKRS
jgi:CO/xanthine dehydrogenase FAD-binding subunit